MTEKTYTEEQLYNLGYRYLGNCDLDKDGHKGNQMWSWEEYKDEFVIFSPEKQRIIKRSTDDK